MTAQFEIPLLTAQDVECRVQSVSKNKSGKVGAILLLYKDARVDMRILDQVFGPSNWQRTHEVINGNLFCNIDIWDSEKKCWVRKQDVGTESYTEKEKGQASDSFKRAGFNVGIGRELYTGPFIYITLDDSEYYTDNKGGIKCGAGTKFEVSHIGYNERREITELTIVDRTGKIRFEIKAKNHPTKNALDTNTPNPSHKPSKQATAKSRDTISIDQAKGLQTMCREKWGVDGMAEKNFEMLTGYAKFGRVKKSEYGEIVKKIQSAK